MLTRFASMAPAVVLVCSGLFSSLLAWLQWRLQRQLDEKPWNETFHERLVRALLLLGGVMLALFIIYALFAIP